MRSLVDVPVILQLAMRILRRLRPCLDGRLRRESGICVESRGDGRRDNDNVV